MWHVSLPSGRHSTVIPEALKGKRVAITGATGFLGTAIVERLLWTVPDCEIVVLIRPGKRTSVVERLHKEIVNNDAFDRLRTREGHGFAAMIDRRLSAIRGDVTTDGLGLEPEGRRILATCSIVIHSAATVSFDAPLDGAVQVNLLGPSRVAAALRDVCAEQDANLPHVVAVSTCYVAGYRRGRSPEMLLTETPHAIDVPWRAEVKAAERIRAEVDSQSRSETNLNQFRKQAQRELGAVGVPMLAEKTEKLRGEWVKNRLVDAGIARARSLGWPDAYTYTKALGERALMETRGDVPISFVRPAIIEAALAEPTPGWIRGFRMADPVIISFARGILKEFPGVPEGVVDVIPVDLVVAAIIGVAARGPSPEGPSVVQSASGIRNPLRYRQLVTLVREWFVEHPLYDDRDQPIVPPKWDFGGRTDVRGQLRRVKRTLDTAERVLGALPLRGKQADWAARLEDHKLLVDRASSYVKLYGAYAESEALYRVDKLLEMYNALPEADKVTFRMDPASIDWPTYVHDVHLPSIVRHARVKMAPGKKATSTRESRSHKAILSPERHVAAFDLENTLIASNVIDSYAWLATRNLNTADRLKFTAAMFREAPRMLMLDRKDRSDFLRWFYRRWNGAPVERTRADAQELFAQLLLLKAFPSGIRRVREHRALGHRTILITGALDFAIEPFRPLFDDIVCAQMAERDGKFTGELLRTPPIAEERATAISEYCEAENLELAESVAYADASSDLPMLEVVGYPVAVNPETKLAAIARKRGWHVEHWAKAGGSPIPLLPIGPLRRHVVRGGSQ